MKKIINKDGIVSVQFTDNDIKEVKKAFYQDVERFLEKRVTISLPLFAIKFLVEKYTTDVLDFDYMMSVGMAINNREGVEAESKAQIPDVIAQELCKQGLDGQKIVQQIKASTEKEWHRLQELTKEANKSGN